MKRAVFVAGGTGGHINSAIALGDVFRDVGFHVRYISGRRYLDFKLYKDLDCLHIRSYGFLGKSNFFILKAIFFNFYSFFLIFFKFILKRPTFVFGTGGYVCGPVLLAAYCLGIHIYILEQNSVLGLTNRILSRFSRIVFTNFRSVKGLKDIKKVKNYGNPIKKEFFEYNNDLQYKYFRILIFGGSLGSSEINDLVADFIKSYNHDIKISIFHQSGKIKAGGCLIHNRIDYERVEYIDQISSEYSRADLIICRGGASTISELRVVQKEVIIIPIKFHGDKHQFYNAELLKEESSFPVHIYLVNELSKDNFKILNEIILNNYQMKKEGKSFSRKLSFKDKNPSTLILNEVLKDIGSLD